MPKVKICGLKTLEDVEIVNKYLPEYVGFVFAPTKRFVTDEQALMMKQALAPCSIWATCPVFARPATVRGVRATVSCRW